MSHPPVDPSDHPEGLPAGVPDESLPDGLSTSPASRSTSDRAKTKGASELDWSRFGNKGGTQTQDANTAARARRGSKTPASTGSEELEAFKPVPFLGRLPWKAQHLFSTLALLFALLILLFVSMAAVSQLNKRSAGMEDTAVAVLVQATRAPLAGTSMPSAASITAAQSRITSTGGSTVIPALERINAGLPLGAQLSEVRQTANDVSQSLNAAVAAMAPQWRAAGSQGQWTSPDAVNFAQALAEVRYLQETTTAMASGLPRPMDNRFPAARQNVEQAIRTFAQSPTSNGPLLEAWRALATGWTASSQGLDVLIGQRANWNEAVAAHQAALELQGNILASGGRLGTPPPPTPSWVKHAPVAIVLSGLAVALALCVLTWVGWKQQRWQALTEIAGAEQVGVALDRLVSQLGRFRPGQPVKLSIPLPMFEPLVSAIRSSLELSRHSHSAVIEHSRTLTQDALSSAEATGKLVDLARQGQEGALEAGQDVLAVTQAFQNILTQARLALSAAGSEVQLDESGANALSEAVISLSRIKARSQEQGGRFQRLSGDARQVQEAARGVSEEADRLAVLAIQAAIQAARAGEAGAGFRVIAEHLKELSERLASSARRAGIGVETLLVDLSAAVDVEADVLAETAIAHQHQEVAQEWLLSEEQKSEVLRQGLNDVMEQASGQEGVVDRLADRATEEMNRLEAFRDVGQLAAEAAAVLSSTAATLDTTLSSRQ